MAKTVYVDQDECIACESCVEICPDVFAMDDDAETAYVKNTEGAPEEDIQEAVDACPVQCIHWKDE